MIQMTLFSTFTSKKIWPDIFCVWFQIDSKLFRMYCKLYYCIFFLDSAIVLIYVSQSVSTLPTDNLKKSIYTAAILVLWNSSLFENFAKIWIFFRDFPSLKWSILSECLWVRFLILINIDMYLNCVNVLN